MEEDNFPDVEIEADDVADDGDDGEDEEIEEEEESNDPMHLIEKGEHLVEGNLRYYWN